MIQHLSHGGITPMTQQNNELNIFFNEVLK